MGAKNRTFSLKLPQFDDRDKPTFRGDINGAFRAIDRGFTSMLSQIAERYTKGESDARYSRKNTTALNVRDFGVKGDGKPEDMATVKLALTMAAGRTLVWPFGDYVMDGNLDGFWGVARHTGEGVIVANGVRFPISPSATDTNTIYVANTGSVLNDGLTADRPVNGVQRAMNALSVMGTFLNGSWKVKLNPGVYDGTIVTPRDVTSLNPIVVEGDTAAHPAVPNVRIGTSYNKASYGFDARWLKTPFIFRGMEIYGYNGSSASCGILHYNSAHMVYTDNVHFTDCYWGMSGQLAPYDVKGGIFLRCGYLGSTPITDPVASRAGGGGAGTRSLMLARHAIGTQNAGDNSKGPIFDSCYQACFAQESSTGHADWLTIQDCYTGLYAGVNSRFNMDGTQFKRNLMDVRVATNGVVFVTANTKFGTGADESTSKIVATSGGQVIDANTYFSNLSPVYGGTFKSLDNKFPNQTVTATTAVPVWSTVLKGNIWRDTVSSIRPRKMLRIDIVGELVGTDANKRLNVRLGNSLVGLLFSPSETGVFRATADIFFSDVDAQEMVLAGSLHLGGNRISRAAGSNTMTADTSLSVEASVDSAGPSVKIYSVNVNWV